MIHIFIDIKMIYTLHFLLIFKIIYIAIDI
jgi:hypothetical protein